MNKLNSKYIQELDFNNILQSINGLLEIIEKNIEHFLDITLDNINNSGEIFEQNDLNYIYDILINDKEEE